ncbi:hypothetical protein JB92DRAFT_3127182 [Gautieria morchelliformis]|nr:hypothetical protein JB92DRAFT_3127182 [Gautieria morchelliformis]
MSFPFTQVPKPKRANRGKKMAALIEEEGLDEDGRPMKHGNLHRQQKRKRKPAKKITQEEDKDEDDDEDGNFSDSSSGDESSSECESDVSHNMIPNHEASVSLHLPIPYSPACPRLLTCSHRKLLESGSISGERRAK